MSISLSQLSLLALAQVSLPLSQAIAKMVTVSDKEESYLFSAASHCCPNCDGPITINEHEHFGLCSHCTFPSQYSP